MGSRFLHLVAILWIALGCAAVAQGVPEVKLPTSPPGQAAIQLGGARQNQRYANGRWVIVDYGRPLLRGRKEIFGSGADYGKLVKDGTLVWRAGANNTTRLTTQAPLVIGGKTINPGTYNVFVDLKPGDWAFLLNTQPVQAKYDPSDTVNLFGAFNYDPKFDILRAPMTVRTSDEAVEQFTIGFVNVTEARATLTMAWEKTIAAIDIRLASAN